MENTLPSLQGLQQSLILLDKENVPQSDKIQIFGVFRALTDLRQTFLTRMIIIFICFCAVSQPCILVDILDDSLRLS